MGDGGSLFGRAVVAQAHAWNLILGGAAGSICLNSAVILWQNTEGQSALDDPSFLWTGRFAYRRRAPFGVSSGTETSTGLPFSPYEAATIIPFDSRPRSLRGCRLATMTTLRPGSVAGS